MLLRHAKTETDAPSGRDQDRRLDARGRKDAAEIGEWIGTHPPRPDAVMVSPAMRAKETWDIASEAIKRHAASAHTSAKIWYASGVEIPLQRHLYATQARYGRRAATSGRRHPASRRNRRSAAGAPQRGDTG